MSRKINISNLYNVNSKSVDNDNGITISNPITTNKKKKDKKLNDQPVTTTSINPAIPTNASTPELPETGYPILVPELELDPEYVLLQERIDVIDSSIDILVNVVSDTYVKFPDIRNITYPKEVRGADFKGYDVDFNISFEAVNTTFVEMIIGGGDNKRILQARRGTFNFNVKEILENNSSFEAAYNNEDDRIPIPFRLTPVNTSGNTSVRGKAETFVVDFDKGDLDIPRDVAINRLSEGFKTQLDNNDDIFDVSKYLTHLLHLGDGNNRIVSNWIGTDDSLILKMYEPLPTSIQLNDKVWVSKLQSEPIIETVTITTENDKYCPPLRGANFALDVDNGIGFDIYDNLISSGSQTSTDLVNEYAQKIGIDTERLNITYTTGSVYAFENFTHFGSAEERIKNFYYKVQLLESYDTTLDALPTGSQNNVNVSLERERTTDKKNTIIQNFDGFETFLYEDSGSLTYPKSGSVLLNSTSSQATDWYNSAVQLGSTYDRNNVHYLNNNLPDHIVSDKDNEDFLLFMDMIGQHFDILWTYISGLSRTKKLESKVDKGITNDLIYHMLESFGWNTEQAYDSKFLWEYAFGKYEDGTQKYDRSLKSANEEVWRRILNNLPYLLKHKGTKRSLQAILSCYGVPESLLTIAEFGGPTDPTTTEETNYTFEDTTAALNFEGLQEVTVPWKSVGEFPGAVEFNLKFDEASDQTIFSIGTGTPLPVGLKAVHTTGSLGKIVFNVDNTGGNVTAETPEIKLFDGNYKHITVNRTLDATSTFDLYVKESVNDRLRINVSASVTAPNTNDWQVADTVSLGTSLVGSVDEFRIWKEPLVESAITNHAKIPDAIDGNSYTASTEDLWFRLDFERPKNRNTDTDILNVAISSDYGEPSGSAVGFDSITEYPYNYTTYNRTVSAKVPSLGYSFANKIRFEDQELVSDLSYKVRATKKAFDRAPLDSPRLGFFFSLNKQINLDILRTFGDFNIDNYIGAPFDRYENDYSDLKTLRDYYFQRITRNYQEYIQLVKYVDKSLFDTLENLVPARARVSKGLLIEPHILERAKVRWNRPESEKNDYEATIDFMDTTDINFDYGVYEGVIDYSDIEEVTSEYVSYEGIIDQGDEIELISEYEVLDTLIDYENIIELIGEAPFYTASIDFELGTKLEALNLLQTQPDVTQVGFDGMQEGFGLYASASHGKVTTIDALGNRTGSRKQIYKITEQYIDKVYTQTEGWPATTNNEGVKYEYVDVTKTRDVITILPFGSDAPVSSSALITESVFIPVETGSWLDTNDTNIGSANIVDFPTDIRLHGNEILDDNLYLIGGISSSGDWNFDIYRLNLSSGSTWDVIATEPNRDASSGNGRANSFTSYDNRMWWQVRTAGSGPYVLNEFLQDDNSVKEVQGLSATGNHGVYTSVLASGEEGVIYIAGGRPNVSSTNKFSSILLSNTSGSVTALDDMPVTNERNALIYIPASLSDKTGASVLSIGGNDSSNIAKSEIYEYDIDANSWDVVARHTLASPIYANDAVLYSGSVYSYGRDDVGSGSFIKYDYTANSSSVLTERTVGGESVFFTTLVDTGSVFYSVGGQTLIGGLQTQTEIWAVDSTGGAFIETVVTSSESNIIDVEPLDGYFSTHYRYVANLSEGLQRSFYKGSKQTADTTPDGLPPVETFTTNPNILRVADAGRGSGEPILNVE